MNGFKCDRVCVLKDKGYCDALTLPPTGACEFRKEDKDDLPCELKAHPERQNAFLRRIKLVRKG